MNRNVLLVGYLTFMVVAATALILQFDTISNYARELMLQCRSPLHHNGCVVIVCSCSVESRILCLFNLIT